MELDEELARIGGLCAHFAAPAEALTGVLAAEIAGGRAAFICAFEERDARSWIVVDAAGEPYVLRSDVREAASIAALCELAEEAAGGGDLGELRGRLVELRLTEAPEGVDEAEDAALALERTIGAPPQRASAARLDAIGAAARRLERALGSTGESPFAAAMQAAVGAAEELANEVEARYKLELR